ncbi:glycerophosphocholine phosphodiesterase GPCPD1 [Tribolium castaneum]|uniref:Glycerophosphocholine phosphodiesterase GPCPD1-like Protein n=1 Tax=Tribolium castaneum TaxID=7070 RepID=D6WL75_TRICA|nr:PREDICTED: glycerophosphocholine phosphodiesterase GPCPD1 [Tribolium castaneum]EFA03495.2 Glycerophosphocholine phosphodiesterase GPCPD1-like Protein [Tribolium castaneum]|eukprot:XP_008193716.1 PREDICTED: glycerophosphocholine phosphodiesterase GPCPD1 [Tribolium castaneum]
MQRWFFLEDPNNAILRVGKGDDVQLHISKSATSKYPPKRWLFRVRAPDLKKDEVMCVSGSVPELGSWQAEKCVPLEREDESDVWSLPVMIPDRVNIQYRFCVCVVIDAGLQVIVRSWEAQIAPRAIHATEKSPLETDEPLTYGDYGNVCRIDRGWLNKETVIQLKFCNNPLTLWRPKYTNRSVYIKVTPVGLLRHNTISKTMSEALEESLSADTQDAFENPKHALSEVASLNAEDSSFHPQPQFGEEYKENDMLVFQCSVLFPANVAFLIDLYIYSSRHDDGEPPHHAGFSYLLPTVLQSSEGSVVLPVTSTKHRPLGQVRIDYIVVRPMPNFKCDLSVSYARHWKKTRAGLDVGHRGSGSSFKTQNCAEVRENTVASLKNAIDHGADFVEFDVQLSKDLVPIVYHDFHVCISMKKKKQLDETDMLELPVKELTLDQLQLLKVYHLSEGKTKNPRFFDEDLEDHQPFPTLQHVLEVLNPHVGFNIEIKWTMQLYDGSFELYHPTDINLYLDTILEVVLRYGGERRIVFSCFNPDICSMIRLKQNKYPVMFLTIGESKVYDRYRDPRCWSIPAAVQYANMIELLGISAHTEDLLRDASLVQLVKRAGLIMFCWGDENADPTTLKMLKELGLHGVIYDKIYQLSSKEVKESIFLVEARESQKDLIRLAAAAAEAPSPVSIIKEQVLDIEKARHENEENVSTATSLESLDSRMSDYEKNGTG